MQELTPKEAALFELIRESLDNGVVPSVRELCAQLHVKSTSTVHRYLTSLQVKGYILREDNLNRSIRLPHSEITRVPIVGAVAAGLPILAEQQVVSNMKKALTNIQNGTFAQD